LRKIKFRNRQIFCRAEKIRGGPPGPIKYFLKNFLISKIKKFKKHCAIFSAPFEISCRFLDRLEEDLQKIEKILKII
jgi:hypothetical protein